MVDIIRINADPHAETQRLLPWYVNGTLKGDDLAQVETHLAECAECREDLEVETTLAWEIRDLPSEVDKGWAALKARVDGAGPAARKTALFGRRIPVSWAMMAQAASLAIFIPALIFALAQPRPLYRTLSAAPAAASGNVIVVFKPESSEAALRTVLTRNQARIVDGPTATNAYVLHVPAEQRTAAIARMKGDRTITLAEPIDGDTR